MERKRVETTDGKLVDELPGFPGVTIISTSNIDRGYWEYALRYKNISTAPIRLDPNREISENAVKNFIEAADSFIAKDKDFEDALAKHGECSYTLSDHPVSKEQFLLWIITNYPDCW